MDEFLLAFNQPPIPWGLIALLAVTIFINSKKEEDRR